MVDPYPQDIFTAPEADPDTQANLGPLARAARGESDADWRAEARRSP